VPRDDILFGICKSESILRSRSALAPDKAEKMSWLIHLVADVYQPLHCATLINSFYPAPEGDRGGNKFFVKVPRSSKAQKLHSLWDELLGRGTARRVESSTMKLRLCRPSPNKTSQIHNYANGLLHALKHIPIRSTRTMPAPWPRTSRRMVWATSRPAKRRRRSAGL
jgi:hypothetical protein